MVGLKDLQRVGKEWNEMVGKWGDLAVFKVDTKIKDPKKLGYEFMKAVWLVPPEKEDDLPNSIVTAFNDLRKEMSEEEKAAFDKDMKTVHVEMEKKENKKEKIDKTTAAKVDKTPAKAANKKKGETKPKAAKKAKGDGKGERTSKRLFTKDGRKMWSPGTGTQIVMDAIIEAGKSGISQDEVVKKYSKQLKGTDAADAGKLVARVCPLTVRLGLSKKDGDKYIFISK